MCVSYNPIYYESVVSCDKKNLTKNIEGRYLLKIKLKNSYTDILTIVMMNPSKADNEDSDSTVNKVIKFVYEMNTSKDSIIHKIGYLNILNVFPAYEPNSMEVKTKLDIIISDNKLQLMQSENRKAYDKAFSESQYIVFAWGDVPSNVKAEYHNHEVIMAYDLIVNYGLEEKVYIIKYEEYEQILTNNKRPRHPSRNNPKLYVKVNTLRRYRKFLYLDVE